MSSVMIFGGYGVFGSLIAQELISRGVSVTIAGRNPAKAQAWVKKFGSKASIKIADATDRSSCLAALQGHSTAVHCAGPFSEKNTVLLESCLEAGCHYVDIADDRRYIARVRQFHDQFLEKGLTAVYGASSLPGISGALAFELAQKRKDPPQEIRVVLFIGNRNPKGEAALESVFKILGKSIEAPQGVMQAMRGEEWVELPSPFGKRLAFNFESAEYDLFPEQFHGASVIVKVSFELKLSNLLFSFLGRIPQKISHLLKTPLRKIGNGMSGWGSSGGAVQVEFSYTDGSKRSAVLLAREEGQTMAVLPAVFSIQELLKKNPPPGVQSAYELLGGKQLLQGLIEAGNQLTL